MKNVYQFSSFVYNFCLKSYFWLKQKLNPAVTKQNFNTQRFYAFSLLAYFYFIVYFPKLDFALFRALLFFAVSSCFICTMTFAYLCKVQD